MTHEQSLLAGIDAGGTSFKIGVASRDGALLASAKVATSDPATTLDAAAARLLALAEQAGGKIEAFGLASFGPIAVDPDTEDYGCILQTPKPGWQGANILAELERRLDAPGGLDTDVNAALLAEMQRGAARACERAAYVTVGTGIGVGIKTGGQLMGRPFHPELGHIRVQRHVADVSFPGVCAIHGDCLEGLASGPALTARFGPLDQLSHAHEAWEIAGFYLAQLCLTISLSARVERIVLGGGVMQAAALLQSVQANFDHLMANYLPQPSAKQGLIAQAALGQDAGLIGALLLAQTIKTPNVSRATEA